MNLMVLQPSFYMRNGLDMKYVFGFVLGSVTSIAAIVIYAAVTADYNDPEIMPYHSLPVSSLSEEDVILDTAAGLWRIPGDLLEDFYDTRFEVDELINILALVDQHFDADNNRNELYEYFTDTLYRLNPLSVDSPVQINNAIRFAENLTALQFLDKYNEPVIRYIGENLLQTIADTLSNGIDNARLNRYSYSVQYLKNSMFDNGYAIATKEDNITKVVENLSNAKLGYLLNRFLIVTPLWIKILLIVASIIVIFSVTQSVILLLRRVVVKNNK